MGSFTKKAFFFLAIIVLSTQSHAGMVNSSGKVAGDLYVSGSVTIGSTTLRENANVSDGVLQYQNADGDWVEIGTVPICSDHPLTTVVCGNSITGSRIANGDGELYRAMQMSPGKIRFIKMTDAFTVSDYTSCYGNYAYGGGTLSQINSDIVSAGSWLDLLDTYELVPDLVVGHALFENDILGGVSYSDLAVRLDRWIQIVRSHFPNCKIIICTPHPSFFNDTASEVSVFQSIREHVLAYQGQGNIWSIDLAAAYENTDRPGTPTGTGINVTQTGTTLTVVETLDYLGEDVTDLEVGSKLAILNKYPEIITALGTGTGGAGTYTVDVSQTISSSTAGSAGIAGVQAYTRDGIHPSVSGRVACAELIAKWLDKHVVVPTEIVSLYGLNAKMEGSHAVSYYITGGSAGTLPTDINFASMLEDNLSMTVSALEPGAEIDLEVLTAGDDSTDYSDVSMIKFVDTDSSGENLDGVYRIMGYASVDISGGEYIRALHVQTQATTDSTTVTTSGISVTATNDLSYLPDGHYLLTTPEIISPTGTLADGFDNFYMYLRAYIEADAPVGAEVVLKILSAGWVDCTGGGVMAALGGVSTESPSTGTWLYQNTTDGKQQVLVSGGTVSAISIIRGGTTYGTGQTAGVFILGPTDILSVANTVVPDVYVLDI